MEDNSNQSFYQDNEPESNGSVVEAIFFLNKLTCNYNDKPFYTVRAATYDFWYFMIGFFSGINNNSYLTIGTSLFSMTGRRRGILATAAGSYTGIIVSVLYQNRYLTNQNTMCPLEENTCPVQDTSFGVG
jgi:hypothetical protein